MWEVSSGLGKCLYGVRASTGNFVPRVYGRNWRKKKEGSNDVNILSSHKRNNKKICKPTFSSDNAGVVYTSSQKPSSGEEDTLSPAII